MTITPFLWYDNNAEEAMKFYASVFKDSKIIGWNGMGGEMEINGQRIMFLNGGPTYKLSEAFSFMVKVKTQDEVDYYWNKLTADGGEESMCGWLKDKYGLSWQITPEILLTNLTDKDRERANRVMQAMLKMKKIIVADIEKAYEGK